METKTKSQLTRTGLEGRHGVDAVDNGVWATAGTQVELGDGDGAHVRRDVHPVIGARPAGGAGWRAGREGEFGIGGQQRRASTLNGGGSPVMQKGQSLAVVWKQSVLLYAGERRWVLMQMLSKSPGTSLSPGLRSDDVDIGWRWCCIYVLWREQGRAKNQAGGALALLLHTTKGLELTLSGAAAAAAA